jgi:hypothetical protein
MPINDENSEKNTTIKHKISLYALALRHAAGWLKATPELYHKGVQFEDWPGHPLLQ